jgi:hypothetical protein
MPTYKPRSAGSQNADDTMLLALARPGLRARLNNRATRFVIGSVLVHGAVIVAAWMKEVEAAEIPPSPIGQFTLQTISFEEDQEPVSVAVNPVGQGALVAPAPATKSAKIASAPIAARRPSIETAVTREEQAAAFAQALVSGDQGANNINDLRSRQAKQDLQTQIAQAQAASANANIGGAATDGTRNTSGAVIGTAPRQNEPAIDGSTRRIDKIAETSTVRMLPPRGPKGTPDEFPEQVIEKIEKVYKAGILRCYRSYMASAGGANGKVALSFTLSESGGVVAKRARGFATELDSCIEQQMANWRFKIEPESAGNEFRLTLQLADG